MVLSIDDQQLLANFRERLATSVKEVESGKSEVKRDANGRIIPSQSKLKPNLFQTKHTITASLDSKQLQ